MKKDENWKISHRNFNSFSNFLGEIFTNPSSDHVRQHFSHILNTEFSLLIALPRFCLQNVLDFSDLCSGTPSRDCGKWKMIIRNCRNFLSSLAKTKILLGKVKISLCYALKHFRETSIAMLFVVILSFACYLKLFDK